MTARAIGVFVLVLAVASPAFAGPKNSTIGAKKLEEDMVHSGGVGYPSITYEWWNRGKKKLDWGLSSDLVYGGSWGVAASQSVRAFGVRVRTGSRYITIGWGINGLLRWHLSEKERPKVTNDVGILFKPGILLSKNGATNDFTFGIKTEVGAPVSIDVHERVSVVTGGYIPFTYFFNKGDNFGIIPLLVRMGVEIKANENVAPWFFFDLGPGINVGKVVSGASFAWRIGAGTAFWGVLGRNKNKSNVAETEVIEVEVSE
ncbi:MAG: hypothetical protein KJO40_18790 [Deltaproteobacteria bacterium]|nr:hypothetical protein [Deltaproteobacteria bacterium]NND28603.1 hypothetical protein [Myxococcales bacterium]MBT8463221.1 hypothetical protein [Deltaproteobacteria bacterium]MBT8481359.1 hypothetical protein [Deltaproteobacteria bacterium]NNK06977.1 hypothetical protein [Myxococcales bacterium]